MANFFQQGRDKTHEVLCHFIKNFFSYLFALPSREIRRGTGMDDALRLWEELKKITNSTDSVMGITFLKYLFKAKDYVPLKDLKDWIRRQDR